MCLSRVTCLNADFSPLSTQRLEVNIRAKTSWYGVRKACKCVSEWSNMSEC